MLRSVKQHSLWLSLTVAMVLSLFGLSPALGTSAPAEGESTFSTELADLGQEPRIEFRFGLRAGTIIETRTSTTNETKVTYSSKMDLPFPKIPMVKAAFEMTHRAHILEILADGKALIEQSLTHSEGSAGEVELPFLKELVGVVFTYKMDARGTISDVTVKKGPGPSASQDAVDFMADLAPRSDTHSLALIMQPKAVGSGAIWKVHSITTQQGKELKATYQGTLTAITANSFNIVSQLTSEPTPEGLQPRVDTSGHTSAKYIKSMPTPQSFESAFTTKARMDMNADGKSWTQGQDMKITVNTESKIVSQAQAK